MKKTIKRALSVLLSLCFVLLYPLAALAEETPYIPFETRHLTLSMETAANSVAPGSVFTVSVRVENNTGFETLKITPTLGEGLVLSGSPVNGTVSSANGADAFSFHTAGGTTATGILVTFNVQVNASALPGAVSLGLDVREATDQEGDSMGSAAITVNTASVVIYICAHTHTHTEGASAATCTTPGSTDSVICDDCGAILSSGETIPTLDHTPSDWIIDTAPTETQDGAKHKECTVCHTVLETAVIPASGSVISEDPRVVVESKTVEAGTEFTVTLMMVNNPGVMSMTLKYNFPSELSLVRYENGDLLSDITWGKTANKFLWNADEDVTEDGLLLTLTFTTDSGLEPGNYTINFNWYYGVDSDENDVVCAIVPGVITVTEPSQPEILWGDANGDGKVNNPDIVRLKNYFANFDDEAGISTNGTTIYTLGPGADANGDGKINNTDIVRLKNYFANYDDEAGISTNGTTVYILGPKPEGN